jgi:hypothetical protein
MIEGSLDIKLTSQDTASDEGAYLIRFLQYTSFRGGSQPFLGISDRDAMLAWLTDKQASSLPLYWRARRAAEWLSAIDNAGGMSLNHWQFTEEQFKDFSAVC